MKIIEFTGVRDFNPDQTFDCGQCFRWRHEDSGSSSAWTGVVGNRVCRAKYDAKTETLTLRDSLPETGGCTQEEAEGFWMRYFDLARDYGGIKKYLTQNDNVMEEAAACGSGIRILNQDRWETLISFIISQNNNIPRIKKCIESVACTLGEPVDVPEEWNTAEKFYSLPSPEVLACADASELAGCRLGYRDKYLIETAKQIMESGWNASEGRSDFLDGLAAGSASYGESIEGLRCLCGVGPKVANCVALFCLGQVNSFPLDVWMKRVMNRFYGIPENDPGAMKQYADEHFAPYGGIAQQYLFYYITHCER